MKKKEETITLTKEQKSKSATKISDYLEQNFECEISNLQAQIFLDYITENIGTYYYNKAVADSMTYLTEKAEDMYLLMKEEN